MSETLGKGPHIRDPFEWVDPTPENKQLIADSRYKFSDLINIVDRVRDYKDQKGLEAAMHHLQIASFFLHKAIARGK